MILHISMIDHTFPPGSNIKVPNYQSYVLVLSVYKYGRFSSITNMDSRELTNAANQLRDRVWTKTSDIVAFYNSS